jgi:hypothetical protein
MGGRAIGRMWTTALEHQFGGLLLAYSVEILDVWPKLGCS